MGGAHAGLCPNVLEPLTGCLVTAEDKLMAADNVDDVSRSRAAAATRRNGVECRPWEAFMLRSDVWTPKTARKWAKMPLAFALTW